ncbi:sulfur oxidation c-type cytochrome SoxX [Mesobacterium sp. TK19101]|uniref:Sulfur oxidation c-type cytochrome SoxX n=1 Tax=Mesobacterium hydrothermale TaxID=3111907 RepID=A0ABU6HD66_9RHOB|nr:sulfur oxidation c-type cytochrome SoxX [Mesobacterium sp. TK19101]MEC3860417.1 sulfur oxidation c-type cytochrome SoxX [Mesobacterium sp. TK19101]
MRLTVISIAAAFAATTALANPVAPDDVVFGEYGEVEASLTGVPGDAANGAKIMYNRGLGNCIACHEVTALKDQPFHGEVGPTLDGTGDVRTEAELRGIVINAKMTFEGSVMPAFYRTSGFTRPGDGYTGKAAKMPIAPILSAQEIEDVVAYLMTLKD